MLVAKADGHDGLGHVGFITDLEFAKEIDAGSSGPAMSVSYQRNFFRHDPSFC
jgi:hypothetical protein